MIEDEHGPFHGTEQKEMVVEGVLKLLVGDLFFRVAIGMGEAVFPRGDIVGDGDERLIFAAAALPLILRHVDGDAVEIGGEEGLFAEAWKSAEETEEDILREIFEVLAAAG